MNSKLFIVLLGAPGSGKGTQIPTILQKYKLDLFSTGDNLKKEMKNETLLGKKIKYYLANGKLVPDQIIIEMLEDLVFKKSKKSNGFLIDGSPRTENQAILFEQMLNKINCKVNAAIDFLVPDNILYERIKGRLIHVSSGRIYHKKFNPPKIEMRDDITNEILIKRKDDNPKILKKRLKEFHKFIPSVRKFYSKLNVLITLNGNQSAKQLSNEILISLNKLI
ncbi:adenylate kinase 4 [Anaeramoeba ignava]|uniref:Adenylate kinase 4 n=1 Tax=Anaeramoeba ignava TaxID=1746090 RepID=A0A9Q0LNB9_ANAIG|nr:adenylate kinase 4 [Anaeramoeba ignava]